MPPTGAPPPLRFFFLPGAETKSPARLSSCAAMLPGVAEPAAAEALVHQGRVRHGPSVAAATDDRVVEHLGVRQEHLVEQRMARHLDQRTHVDALLVHVEREPGDALVLRQVRVRPGDEHAQIRDRTERRPDLLAVDGPLVAVELGLAGQTRQVGTGAGLTEELAPRLHAGDDVADVQVDLLLGAVGGDGRSGEQQPEAAGRGQRAVGGDLGLDPDRVVARQAAAVGVGGQTRGGPSGQAQALPPLAHRQVDVPVLLEPGAQLVDDVVAAAGGRGGVGGLAHVYSFPLVELLCCTAVGVSAGRVGRHRVE